MPDEPAYTWDGDDFVFRDPAGKAVMRRAVRGDDDSPVDELAAILAFTLRGLAERFVAEQDAAIAAADAGNSEESDRIGSEAFAVWQADSEGSIKAHVATAAVIATGGRDQATEATRRLATATTLFHLQFFRNFVGEVASGAVVLDGHLPARAELYGGSAVQAYEAEWRERHGVHFREERRYTASGHSCGDCISYEAQGWVPVGTLPGIGESCACHGNCRCGFLYRLRV